MRSPVRTTQRPNRPAVSAPIKVSATTTMMRPSPGMRYGRYCSGISGITELSMNAMNTTAT
ncbi:hypothetical protein D3C83_334170 [compost metagenome]